LPGLVVERFCVLTPDPTGAEHQQPTNSLVGALIAGKYRLRRLIGRGGMGTVYKAENLAIGRTVALKVLHGHLTDDNVTVARFQREARAAASVGHENIIDILDMGVEPSGAPFLVMEYLRGKSLARTLREEGAMSVERAARVAGQVLAALAAAHGEGIIHRDLSASNVLLTTRHGRPDFVKLFDFGVAAFVDAAQDQTGKDDLTPSGRTMGTPKYASPEQLLGDRVRDARVDLWAVGVLLYEMVSGRVPFNEASFPELCRAITDLDPPSFASLRIDVPPAFQALVTHALAKRADHRFQSAEEMLKALVPFGADEQSLDSVETTDTLTLELRELRARELLIGESDPMPPDRMTVVRGEALAGILEFFEHQLGRERYAVLLAEEPELKAAVDAGLAPNAWYPSGFLHIVERIDRQEGRGDRKLVAEAGRHLARRAFMKRDRDILLKTLTPELLFSLVPELFTRYFAVGQVRVTKIGRGYGRLEVVEMPAAFLARSVAIAGYLDEALRMAGGRNVDVRLAAAAALGDPMDIFEATWSS
jgi:serine/threonine protein kinase